MLGRKNRFRCSGEQIRSNFVKKHTNIDACYFRSSMWSVFETAENEPAKNLSRDFCNTSSCEMDCIKYTVVDGRLKSEYSY